MFKLHHAVFIFFMVFSVIADIKVGLNGTVKDENNEAIAGAIVTLLSDSTLNDTTNTLGEFTISKTAVNNHNGASKALTHNFSCITIKNKQFELSISSPANTGGIYLFSANGKKNVIIPPGRVESGVHSYSLHQLAAGFYIIHFTLDQDVISFKLVNTGSDFFISNAVSQEKSGSGVWFKAADGNIDTLIIKKTGFKVYKKAITSYQQTNISIMIEREVERPVYDYAATVENTCSDCVVPKLSNASELNAKNSKLPNPFQSIDGTEITKKSQWRCRRQEILMQAQKYIFGEKPTPDVVNGTVSQNKITVHVEEEGKAIDFSADVVLPSNGEAPFPAIINVGIKGGFGGITLGESRILEQGVAVIYYNHYDLGKEGTPEQSRGKPNSGKFYDIYGGNHSAGLLMSWAWGASRLIDVLQQSKNGIIDPQRLGVTGCSRNGKGAFTIGLFDERIALTIPQETSTAGVPAYRIVDKLNTERTDHNYNGLNWLSNNFEPFVFNNNTSNAVKLPIDAHSLVATFAPRGLMILENPSAKQMSAPAGYVSAAAGAEVYKALSVAENISYSSNTPNGTGHCSYVNQYTEPLVNSIKKFLKHEDAETGKIIAGSGGTLNLSDWIDWEAPTLENDTHIYETN